MSTCSIVWLSSTCLVVSDTGSYLESFEIFKNLFDHFYKYLPQNEYLKIKIFTKKYFWEKRKWIFRTIQIESRSFKLVQSELIGHVSDPDRQVHGYHKVTNQGLTLYLINIHWSKNSLTRGSFRSMHNLLLISFIGLSRAQEINEESVSNIKFFNLFFLFSYRFFNGTEFWTKS